MGVTCSKKMKSKRSIIKINELRAEKHLSDPKFEIVLISESKLYNLFVKKLFDEPNKMEIFNSKHEFVFLEKALQLQQNYLFTQIINTEKLLNNVAKEIKILFDFKTIIILKEKERPSRKELSISNFISFLEDSHAIPKTIYIFEKSIDNFLGRFSLLRNLDKFLNKIRLPFLIYDNHDMNPSMESSQETLIYVEEDENFLSNINMINDFYSKFLGISLLIILDDSKKYINNNNLNEIKKKTSSIVFHELAHDSDKQIKKIFQKNNNLKNLVLFVYCKSKYQEFIDFLVNLLTRLIKIPPEGVLKYLKELHPEETKEEQLLVINNKIILEKSEKQVNYVKKNSKKKLSNINSDPQLSRCDKMKLLLEDIQKNKGDLNKIKEIIQQLLSNLINNPENEKYRTIKNTNEKLKKTIFSSPSTKKLLELCGFLNSSENPEIYNNALDLSNLKIIKSDFDLASKDIFK